MVRWRELPETIRGKNGAVYESGQGFKKISKNFPISHSTIQEEGNSTQLPTFPGLDVLASHPKSRPLKFHPAGSCNCWCLYNQKETFKLSWEYFEETLGETWRPDWRLTIWTPEQRTCWTSDNLCLFDAVASDTLDPATQQWSKTYQWNFQGLFSNWW